MIRKLRIKFVALSMGLLLLLLTVILGAVNLLNYYSVINYSDSVLDILTDNNGAFPDKFDRRQPEHNFSMELPYETRYFTVHLNDGGQVVFADTGKIAAVNTETAIHYAMTVSGSGTQSGFIGDYRYTVKKDPLGSLIVFLDCGRRLNDFQDFMVISICITLAGYAVVFILMIFFSKKIVKPFSENYEKQKLFITDAGHELKTPLTIIDADADVLEMEIGENEWLRDIQKQTKRLAVLTQALVYLSRMEETGADMPAIDFPLSDVILETAQSFQALALSQNKRIILNVQPMLTFCGDDKAFRQLTSILLDNAVKYSGEEGVISLRLYQSGRIVRLSVQNTSGPISDEELEHLFDRFYRTDKSRNTETGGHGIGLSIAKAIVTAHKGTIQASSPDKNSLLITAAFPL